MTWLNYLLALSRPKEESTITGLSRSRTETLQKCQGNRCRAVNKQSSSRSPGWFFIIMCHLVVTSYCVKVVTAFICVGIVELWFVNVIALLIIQSFSTILYGNVWFFIRQQYHHKFIEKIMHWIIKGAVNLVRAQHKT